MKLAGRDHCCGHPLLTDLLASPLSPSKNGDLSLPLWSPCPLGCAACQGALDALVGSGCGSRGPPAMGCPLCWMSPGGQGPTSRISTVMSAKLGLGGSLPAASSCSFGEIVVLPAQCLLLGKQTVIQFSWSGRSPSGGTWTKKNLTWGHSDDRS